MDQNDWGDGVSHQLEIQIKNWLACQKNSPSWA